MNEMDRPRRYERYQRRYRRSIFWPLALIVIGVVLLANNLGVLGLPGSDNLWNLWPVLLILIGLDDMLARSQFVGGAFWVGLGAVLLLSNLGYLRLGAWPALLSLWPVLVIALGLDLILGRRHWAFSAIGAVVVLGVLYLSVMSLLGGNLAARTRQVDYNLQGAQTIQSALELPVGMLRVQKGETFGGRVPQTTGFELIENFRLEDGKGTLTWNTRGAGPALIGPGRTNWELNIPPAVETSLAAKLGAGEIDMDLSGLQVSGLGVETGVGSITVRLPQGVSVQGQVKTAIGQVTLIVPEGAGVRIQLDRALSAIRFPAGYVRVGNVYTSPNYETAEYKIDLTVGAAIGVITVK